MNNEYRFQLTNVDLWPDEPALSLHGRMISGRFCVSDRLSIPTRTGVLTGRVDSIFLDLELGFSEETAIDTDISVQLGDVSNKDEYTIMAGREACDLDTSEIIAALGIELPAVLSGRSEGLRSVEQIVSALKEESDLRRMRTCERLERIGSVDAIPHLIGACSDTEVHVRSAAIRALIALEARQAIPVFERILMTGTDPEMVQGNCIRAIETFQATGSIPALVHATRSWSAKVRIYAAEALGKIGDSSVMPALEALLDDQTNTLFIVPELATADPEKQHVLEQLFASPELRRMVGEKMPPGGAGTVAFHARRAIAAIRSREASMGEPGQGSSP